MCRHLVFVAALVSTHSTLTHDRVTDNQGRTGCFGFRLGQCPADFRYIVSVDCDDFPTPCFVFHGYVFCRHFAYGCGKLDVVGIVKHNQVVQSQRTGNTSGSLRNLFLDATIGYICVDRLIHDVTQACFQELGGDSSTYGVSVALSQRTGCVFYTTHHVDFGMSRSHTTPLAELFQFVDREFACEGEY